jgi:uncharacterized protein YciI
MTGLSRYEKRRRIWVRVSAGPTWADGPPENQPGWDAHNDFIDDLIDRGVFVMGGPFSDNSGSLSLWEGLSVDETREIVAADPFVQNGVFVVEDVREWTIYVDQLPR